MYASFAGRVEQGSFNCAADDGSQFGVRTIAFDIAWSLGHKLATHATTAAMSHITARRCEALPSDSALLCADTTGIEPGSAGFSYGGSAMQYLGIGEGV
ncbi:hypothetical protein EJB05_07145, partial [Eragrostis curvula]